MCCLSHRGAWRSLISEASPQAAWIANIVLEGLTAWAALLPVTARAVQAQDAGLVKPGCTMLKYEKTIGWWLLGSAGMLYSMI
eukprot:1342498-Amphidinium_carterae.1